MKNMLVTMPALRKKRKAALLPFTLTGQDTVGLSGEVVQTPVPLPAAALLFASGLSGIAWLRRKEEGLTV